MLSIYRRKIFFYTVRFFLLIGVSVLLTTSADATVRVERGLRNVVDSAKVLYNGIRLPDVWPPKTQDPKDISPMSVPYLENPPEVIPINVGRQLFVDDFLVESTTLERVFHQAKKYEKNPVFYPETSYELSGNEDDSAVTYLGQGGVFYDPEDKVFKMFYTAGWRGGLALATSKDLVEWTRPDLGLAGHNIIVPLGSLMAGGDNAIWLDLNTKDPQQRYKSIQERWGGGHWKKYFSSRKELPRHTVHISADGRVWSHGVPTGTAGDYTSFFTTHSETNGSSV